MARSTAGLMTLRYLHFEIAERVEYYTRSGQRRPQATTHVSNDKEHPRSRLPTNIPLFDTDIRRPTVDRHYLNYTLIAHVTLLTLNITAIGTSHFYQAKSHAECERAIK